MAACPELKPYQVVGVNFLLLLHSKGVKGGAHARALSGPALCAGVAFHRSVRRMPIDLVAADTPCPVRVPPLSAAILADEMGLGKTAQSITYLGVVTAQNGARDLERAAANPGAAVSPTALHRKPHLVIAPVSVLENWQRELALWAPALRVACLHGPNRAATRDAIRLADRRGLPPPFDVVLASYTAFERDSDETRDDRSCLVRGRV